MAQPTFLQDLVKTLWPLSKVAFRWSQRPVLGAFIRPFFNTRHNQAIIIPVNEAIQLSPSSTLPFQLLTPLIEQASARFQMNECLCRRNDNCQTYPHELGCLYLGDGARQIHPALGHPVSVSEALDHVQNAMQHGLVPLIAHSTFDAYLLGIPFRRMLTICFCCDCCCAIRHGMRMGPPAFWEVVNRLPGLSVEVSDDCLGCGTCLDTCSVHAISLRDNHAWIDEHCKGCGLCLEACPADAIHLRLSEEIDVYDRLVAGLNERTDIYSHS